MEVSILSKGSSLTQTWPRMGVGAVTVAINQAIVAAPSVDWLCMLDTHVLTGRSIPPPVQPMIGLSPAQGVLTAQRHMAEAEKAFPGKLIVGSDCIKPVGHHRIPFTSLAAVWFAQQALGATTLHLHGFDMDGSSFLGEVESIERGARRWPDEREIVGKVAKALREAGCVIHFYGAFKA